jgi:hypothetical protein
MVRHVERKALQIHNLYIVVIKGTTNLLHSLYAVVTLHWSAPCMCGKRETHIHDILNTYSYLLKGKSLKSEGICMPGGNNKGIHGNCLIGPQLGHAEPKKIPTVSR